MNTGGAGDYVYQDNNTRARPAQDAGHIARKAAGMLPALATVEIEISRQIFGATPEAAAICE
jgi:hypothetical protein